MKLRAYAEMIQGHDIAGASAAVTLAEDAFIRYLDVIGGLDNDLNDQLLDLSQIARTAATIANARGTVELAQAHREIADTIDD